MANKEPIAANPKAEKAAPVDVKSSVPLEVKITEESVEALGGDTVAPVPETTIAETTVTPVAVTLTATVPPPPPATVTKDEGVTLLPTTTEAEDITAKGQRRVNLIWEMTQAGISILITGAVIYCAAYRIPSDNLANAFFLIIGFYFSRTNHQSIGGMGTKPANPYIGRII